MPAVNSNFRGMVGRSLGLHLKNITCNNMAEAETLHGHGNAYPSKPQTSALIAWSYTMPSFDDVRGLSVRITVQRFRGTFMQLHSRLQARFAST